MRATPDVASKLEAESETVPATLLPAETPEVISAGAGAARSTKKPPAIVARFPARSSTKAVISCRPSARSVDGVCCRMNSVRVKPVIGRPSSVMPAGAPVVPRSASLIVTEIVGVGSVVADSGAGLRERTGGSVSVVENTLVALTV